ncbi:hypothetical protein NMY22_g6020 [Coprinellus aureogranulatus]|nr:hypothetical protein NMY22_g6020 [Coprinellus aureogranulatus]
MNEVERVVYRVPKHGLEECSSVFRDMFSLPQGEPNAQGTTGMKEGDSDENPITLVGCTIGEFKCLINVLYPLLGKIPQLSKEEWACIEARKALGYACRGYHVAKLAIEKLNGFSLNLLEKIKLGKEYGVPQWLREGYTSLVQDISQTSLSELASLGTDTAFRIMWARDELGASQSKTSKATGYWVNASELICGHCRHYQGIIFVVRDLGAPCLRCGQDPASSGLGVNITSVASMLTAASRNNSLETIKRKVEEIFKEELDDAERKDDG